MNINGALQRRCKGENRVNEQTEGFKMICIVSTPYKGKTHIQYMNIFIQCKTQVFKKKEHENINFESC